MCSGWQQRPFYPYWHLWEASSLEPCLADGEDTRNLAGRISKLLPLYKQLLYSAHCLFVVSRKLRQLLTIGIARCFSQFFLKGLHMVLGLLNIAFHILNLANFDLCAFFATGSGPTGTSLLLPLPRQP